MRGRKPKTSQGMFEKVESRARDKEKSQREREPNEREERK